MEIIAIITEIIVNNALIIALTVANDVSNRSNMVAK